MSAIPEESTVLVTGANGFVASHVIDQLLSNGYKVRGTVRSAARGQWLVDYFSKKYGPDRFELATVVDMSLPAAFDNVLTGVSGVAHVASDLSFSPNAEEVIPGVESAINNILESAAKLPEIKRFVLTSSSAAAVYPTPEKRFTVDKDSWNDYSVGLAYKTDEEGKQARNYHVYCASKVASERALWKFMREQKPHFAANAVLPDFVMGKILGRNWGQQGSTGGAVVDFYAETGGKQEAAIGMLKMVPPQWMVNVEDTARLHVAALTDPDITSERIFAFAETYNNIELLAALQKLKPSFKSPIKFEDDRHDLSTIDPRERAEEILKKHFGQGFKGFDESVAESIEAL